MFVSKKISHHPISYKHRTYLPQRKLRCRSTEDSAIFAPFFMAYIEHVCGSRMSQTTCFETQMIIPPYDEQVEIVATMRRIYDHVDISNVDGTIFRLLLAHDTEKIDRLLGLVSAHNRLRSEIADIIENAP